MVSNMLPNRDLARSSNYCWRQALQALPNAKNNLELADVTRKIPMLLENSEEI